MHPWLRTVTTGTILVLIGCTASEQALPAGETRQPVEEVREPEAAPEVVREVGQEGGQEVAAEPTQEVGRVCPDPANPCPGFRERDLSFVLPTDTAVEAVVARPEIRSEPFYAVILRSGASCFPDEERLALQALFPRNKVFAGDLFECDDDAEYNYLSYTGVSAGATFLAVFAGTRREEAEAFLTNVRQLDRFPGANLRRMEVVFGFP